MSDSSNPSWQRVITEGAVIVFSILLAFAIDAWWGQRQERSAERVLLLRLQADFLELASALEVVELEHRGTHDAAVGLLGLKEGDTVPEAQEWDLAVGMVFMAVRTFQPGSGAVASFVTGNGAQLIRNQTLSDKLFAWSAIVAELQEEELSMQKAASERWTPFLSSRVSLGPYVAAFGNIVGDLPDAVATPVPRKSLIVDEAFHNYVLERYRWQVVALRDLEPVLEAVDEILTLIERELEA